MVLLKPPKRDTCIYIYTEINMYSPELARQSLANIGNVQLKRQTLQSSAQAPISVMLRHGNALTSRLFLHGCVPLFGVYTLMRLVKMEEKRKTRQFVATSYLQTLWAFEHSGSRRPLKSRERKMAIPQPSLHSLPYPDPRVSQLMSGTTLCGISSGSEDPVKQLACGESRN